MTRALESVALAEFLAGAGALTAAEHAAVVRYAPDGGVTALAGWPAGAALPETGLWEEIQRTGEPVQRDGHAGCPLIVDDGVWGALSVHAAAPLAPGTAPRLRGQAGVLAVALATQDELRRLVDEQAALGRVAKVVAGGATPAEVFDTVISELGRLLGVGSAGLVRFDGDAATVLAGWGRLEEAVERGARLPLGGNNVLSQIMRTRQTVRIEGFAEAATGEIGAHARSLRTTSAVGGPIFVAGRLWGAMVAAALGEEPMPADTERRLDQFTTLVGTAIANTEARVELAGLADEQAALRRVATLVASSADPPVVFSAVVDEVMALLGAAQVGLMRAESADEVTIVAMRGRQTAYVGVGARIALDGHSATRTVLRTGRSARIAMRGPASGTIAEIARRAAANVVIGAPIMVDGRVWGAITATWEHQDEPPDDAEERLTQFAALLDTSVANAHSRDRLKASRARVLSAGDDARRQVVRDLHDGAQQRLVHTIVTLKLAARAFDGDGERARALLAEATHHAEQSITELRELAHGILPAALSHGGLRDAVDDFVERLAFPVTATVTETRLAPEIEANAYFIVAEALTNVVKHAHATRAEVRAKVQDDTLIVEVRDDGVGGGDPRGRGLLGIADRAAALDGRLRLVSPPGRGTVVTAELPLGVRSVDGPESPDAPAG
jgi:signal transduction histidine kinase